MNDIYVALDAAVLARMASAPEPPCDALFVRHGRPNEVLAAMLAGNILADDWLIDLDVPASQLVTWSGTLADDLFAAHPHTWMAPGRDALRAFCDSVGPQLDRHDRTLCLRPHSRHVLSDVQSVLDFMRERAGQPFGLSLDPTAMLEPGMHAELADHLTRIIETLGPLSAMVILRDVQLDGAGGVEAQPLGSGDLPRDLVRQLLGSSVDPAVPIVISGDAPEQQLAWIGA